MQLPCENCISFAMCKTREVNPHPNLSNEYERLLDTINLRRHCRDFHQWYYTETNVEAREKLAKLFNVGFFFE